MKRVLGFAMLAAMVASAGMGQVSPWRAYELYSWERPSGGWNFCLLPSPSGVNISPEQVFSGHCLIRGVSDLDRRIAGLSPGATVFWLDRFTGTGEKSGKGGTLEYPPSDVVMKVKHQAESHKIKLETKSGNSGLSK